MRWVARTIRVEWRQHLLVIAMVGFGIVVATLLVSSLVRSQTPQARWDGDAAGEVRLFAGGSDPVAYDELQTRVEALHAEFPDTSVEVSGRRGRDGVTLMSADPEASLVAVNYELLEGRWPQEGETALTPRAVDLLSVVVGESVLLGGSYPLGGRNRIVVGVWENPNNLDLSAGLVAPADLVWNDVIVRLPSVDHPSIDAYLMVGEPNSAAPDSISSILSDRTGSGTERTAAAGLAYLGATLLCLQVAVLASAGFTVLAQRRTRQLGILSAMGASPQLLGSVMTTTGLICGLIGGLAGLAVGVALVVLTTPLLQMFLDHRISSLDIAWGYLLPAIPLAVLTALGAAWWPARRVRKMSTVGAISARRPPVAKVAPSLFAGTALLGAGTWSMIEGAPKNDALWIIAAAVSICGGAVLLVPGILSVMSVVAGRAPLPVRVAWRDLSRHRSRSTAAVAAAAIAIAIPFAAASFTASLSNSWVPNFPDNFVRVDVDPSTATGSPLVPLDQGPQAFAQLVDLLPDANLVPVQFPIDKDATAQLSQDSSGTGGQPAVEPLQIDVIRGSGLSPENVALGTPELLDALAITGVGPDTDLISLIKEPLDLPAGLVVEQRKRVSSAVPALLIVDATAFGVEPTDSAVFQWFITQPESFTQVELDLIDGTARRDDRLRIERPDHPDPYLAIRTAALAVAFLLGATVVAISVALIRVESDNETRALHAIGARPRTSRAIAAATAVGTVLVAVTIAIPSSLLLLAGIYLNPNEPFDFIIPWPELAVLTLALPASVGAGSWLLASTTKSRFRW